MKQRPLAYIFFTTQMILNDTAAMFWLAEAMLEYGSARMKTKTDYNNNHLPEIARYFHKMSFSRLESEGSYTPLQKEVFCHPGGRFRVYIYVSMQQK